MFYPKQKTQRTVKEKINLWKQSFPYASNASYNNKLSWDGIMKRIRETPGIYRETSQSEVFLKQGLG